MVRTAIGWIMGLAGAAAGAFLGYLLFQWAKGQGFYAMVVPGACLGLGAHLASPTRSWLRGAVMGIAALVLGLLLDSHSTVAPYDDFAYYLTHIQEIGRLPLLMVAVGGIVGFWWGREASPWASRMGLQPLKVERRVQGEDR